MACHETTLADIRELVAIGKPGAMVPVRLTRPPAAVTSRMS
jgi:hypothetical protein